MNTIETDKIKITLYREGQEILSREAVCSTVETVKVKKEQIDYLSDHAAEILKGVR